MVVYYALLSITTVCENLDLMERVLSRPTNETSVDDSIYVLVPPKVVVDAEYKEDILAAIVNCMNQAIEDKLKFDDCKQELLCIGVVQGSINSLSSHFSREKVAHILISNIELVSSRSSNFRILCCQGSKVIDISVINIPGDLRPR